MKITPYGAAGGEVTGSAYHIQTKTASILVDFGLYQGGKQKEARNFQPTKFSIPNLDAVLLTHAHLDHCGRTPLLLKSGFQGKIYCTPATADLADLMLHDSARIQVSDMEKINRKRERQGLYPLEPLYTPDDVDAMHGLFQKVQYDTEIEIAEGIRAVFVEAGHMLGSSCIELIVEENGHRKTVVFSGDLGPRNIPILEDYERIRQADIVFMESTYGDRDHKSFDATVEEFFGIIRNAVNHQQKILVPSFAVGRAQMLMTLLAWAFRTGELPPFPVYLDSPMANSAFDIYNRHPELWDKDMVEFSKKRSVSDELKRTQSKVCLTAEESMELNHVKGPCLILAGAGMCNAGRILHHLRNSLFKKETVVVMVGYQGEGTLGRNLVDGKKEVKIFGEKIAVKATIHTLGGFSAHAGQSDLLNWLSSMAPGKPAVYLAHGEDRARDPLQAEILKRFKIKAEKADLAKTIKC